jgi:hypothetical protein
MDKKGKTLPFREIILRLSERPDERSGRDEYRASEVSAI